ncbi:MAG: diadenylate cyclase CdaA [Anaerolineaceae bacterium]|nr:diadenylate cyclase CdaA [Anaerolineaceae bacterium]
MLKFVEEIIFIFERLAWTSVFDIFLVTLIFFVLLVMIQGTKAMMLMRGMILLVVGLLVLTQIVNLPAFSWLVITAMPALLLAVPVIFTPEIRRGLERLGRTSGKTLLAKTSSTNIEERSVNIVHAIMTAIHRLSNRKHGALIVFQRNDLLNEYAETGVQMGARVTAEILLQIFYPNTPLHDGAVIIDREFVVAGSCVLPLSSSGVLNDSPDREMGLRHRASLGVSEESDALVVVVSEETGSISIAKGGQLDHGVSFEDLKNELRNYYNPELGQRSFMGFLKSLFLEEDADLHSQEGFEQ